jgi:hypothetical protein
MLLLVEKIPHYLMFTKSKSMGWCIGLSVPRSGTSQCGKLWHTVCASCEFKIVISSSGLVAMDVESMEMVVHIMSHKNVIYCGVVNK